VSYIYACVIVFIAFIVSCQLLLFFLLYMDIFI